MRTLALITLLSSIMILSTQCKTKKESTENTNVEKKDEQVEEKDQEQETSDRHRHTVESVLVSGDFDKSGSAPVEIKSAKVKGNELILTVSHSGGCGPHHFKLMGSNAVMKSLPPIRGLYLYHDNKGDQCRALLEHELIFDISLFTYKVEDGSEIKLRLEGWKDDLDYTYMK